MTGHDPVRVGLWTLMLVLTILNAIIALGSRDAKQRSALWLWSLLAALSVSILLEEFTPDRFSLAKRVEGAARWILVVTVWGYAIVSWIRAARNRSAGPVPAPPVQAPDDD